MKVPQPGSPFLVSLAVLIVVGAVLSVMLNGAGAGGLIPLLPVGVAGGYLVVRWFRNRALVRKERLRADEFDRELRALFDREK